MAAKKVATIAVKFGRLTEPLEVVKVPSRTSVLNFLKERGIEFGPNVRVNGEEVDEETMLHEGDIVTDIDSVAGGR